MGVLVILEMDGDTDALLAASAFLQERLPTSAVLARVIAPAETGVVLCTLWESAQAREEYQAHPEYDAALQESGLLEVMTDRRSRVYDEAELTT